MREVWYEGDLEDYEELEQLEASICRQEEELEDSTSGDSEYDDDSMDGFEEHKTREIAELRKFSDEFQWAGELGIAA